MLAIMKTRYLFLTLAASLLLTSCYDQSGEDRHQTEPGRRAFQYCMTTVHPCALVLFYANRFNEYLAMDRQEDRDIVKLGLLQNVTITQDSADAHLFVFTKTVGTDEVDTLMRLQTHGHNLVTEGNTWTVSDYMSYGTDHPVVYDILSKGQFHWTIASHAGQNALFSYTAAWDVHFLNYQTFTLAGGATLLSREDAPLRLVFSTEEPLRITLSDASAKEDILVAMGGTLKILATPSGRQTAEETTAAIASGAKANITYMNRSELWTFTDGTLCWSHGDASGYSWGNAFFAD